MNTLQDLRDSFDELERVADAHPLPDLARRARRPARRRRAALTISAAGVLTAAATVVALAVAGSPPASHPRTRVAAPASRTVRSVLPSPRLTWAPPSRNPWPPDAPTAFPLTSMAYSVGPVPGFRITGSAAFAELQQSNLDGTDGSHYDLTLNALGGYAPKRPAGARPVEVDTPYGRRPGFYGALDALPVGVASGRPVGLAWQWADGAWATLASWDTGSIPLSTALRLARAVRPTPGARRTVPVRVPALGHGLELGGVSTGAGSTRSGQHGRIRFDALIDYALRGQAGTVVSIDVRDPRPGGQLTGTHLVIGGRDAYASGDTVEIVDTRFVVDVHQTSLPPSGRMLLSPAQLVAVARSLTIAPRADDTSTWFDAAQALH